MGIYSEFRKLDESLLLEYNRKDLKNFVGDEYTNKFLNLRQRLNEPENDLGYWIKKNDPEELKRFIDKWESGDIKSKNQAKKEERVDGADLIYQGEGWKVYFVKTYKAAAQLGSGTTWCITGRYHGAEERGKYYFDSYIKNYDLNGGYYFIFDTTQREHVTGDYVKYCIGVSNTGQIKFIFNGIQDRDITTEGIPCNDIERQVQFIPGVTIKYKSLFELSADKKTIIKINNLDDGNKDLVIPEGIEAVKKLAGANTQFESVKFPSTLAVLGAGAFYNSGLKNVNVPNCALGQGAFANCFNLESIVFDEGIKELPKAIIGICPNLKYVIIKGEIERLDPQWLGMEDFISLGMQIQTDSKKVIDFCKSAGLTVVSYSTGEVLSDSDLDEDCADDKIGFAYNL